MSDELVGEVLVGADVELELVLCLDSARQLPGIAIGQQRLGGGQEV
ncbi:hypothetical protein IU427_08460 [Nocardia beijingensis]|nr:hypothetical protein [Nocardia beijingensis]MBF6465217.1 hypothetical protein [Nocardia beijingensis]